MAIFPLEIHATLLALIKPEESLALYAHNVHSNDGDGRPYREHERSRWNWITAPGPERDANGLVESQSLVVPIVFPAARSQFRSQFYRIEQRGI